MSFNLERSLMSQNLASLDRTVPSTKSTIVTSALPYANGEIHLGHIASTYLPADIFTRYLRLEGNEVYHICASDDYGTPVLIKAEKEDKTPSEYVKFWKERDEADFKSIGISFDFFYSTSAKENKQFVQYVFKKLFEKGHIYEQEVVQFYCEQDKKFLPDRYVVGVCPYCLAENQYSDICERCGRVPVEILNPKCSICGLPPVKRTSNHYFFKLSFFSDKLKKWLTNNENLQLDIVKYVLNWIKEGLTDWDITRDLSWGIPVPRDNASGKVFYGWFDNHLCYISALVVFAQNFNRDAKEFWNSSEIYHFIGKDIVYPHYLFLPAIRMGIEEEYKLPDFMPCRGHLMLQNQKISKSRNWYISLSDFIDSFNADYLRFYLASITPYSQTDINFDWDDFSKKINNELIANIGNFINRTLSFICKSFDGEVPNPLKYDEVDQHQILSIKMISNEVGSLILQNEFAKALRKILMFATKFNQYFQKKKPWANKEEACTTLYISVNAVRSLAIVLQPYIPFSVEKIWLQLGFKDSVSLQGWKTVSEMKIRPGHILGKVEPVFHKIERKEIDEKKLELTRRKNER